MQDLSNIISTKTIDNIMDLVYISYVGKYVKEEYNQDADFSYIDCSKIIGKLGNEDYNMFISYACSFGWLNSTLDYYSFAFKPDFDLDNYTPKFFNKSLSQVGLKDSYDISDYVTKLSIKLSDQQLFYISLIAWLAVKRSKVLSQGGTWKKPALIFHNALFDYRFNAVFLTHILHYPEVDSIISSNYDELIGDKKAIFDYDTWVYDNTNKGNLRSNGYTINEKYQHTLESKYYQVGLPVFIYEKNSNLTAGNISGLKKVSLGIIRDISTNGISIDITNINSTKEDINKIIEDNDYLDEYLMYDENIGAMHSRLETLDYISTGIDHMMLAAPRRWSVSAEEKKQVFLDGIFEEKIFIRGIGDLLNTSMYIQPDHFPKRYTTGHAYYSVEMRYADAVYWLLDSWGIDFNKRLYTQIYKDYLLTDTPLAEMDNQRLVKTLFNTGNYTNIDTAMRMQSYIDANFPNENSVKTVKPASESNVISLTAAQAKPEDHITISEEDLQVGIVQWSNRKQVRFQKIALRKILKRISDANKAKKEIETQTTETQSKTTETQSKTTETQSAWSFSTPASKPKEPQAKPVETKQEPKESAWSFSTPASKPAETQAKPAETQIEKPKSTAWSFSSTKPVQKEVEVRPTETINDTDKQPNTEKQPWTFNTPVKQVPKIKHKKKVKENFGLTHCAIGNSIVRERLDFKKAVKAFYKTLH